MQLEPFDSRRPSRCYAEAAVNSSGCLLSTYLTDAYKETRALLGPLTPPGNRQQGLGLAPLVGARLLCTALLLLLPRQGIGVVRVRVRVGGAGLQCHLLPSPPLGLVSCGAYG